MRTFRPTIVLLLLVAAVAGLAALQPPPGTGAHPAGHVRAGYDLLEVDPTRTTSNVALPDDFFGPGSDPFIGVVAMQGVPIPSYTPPGLPTYTGLGPTDTIVHRITDGGPTFPDTVPIEIVALNLKSKAPITVTYGGVSPEQWNIFVEVPENDPDQTVGSLYVRHETYDGGTYDLLDLFVDPDVTFKRVSDGYTIGPQRYSTFPWGMGLPMDFRGTDIPWCHSANPLAFPPGNWVIEKPGLTTNFFGGMTCLPGAGAEVIRVKDYYQSVDVNLGHVTWTRPAEVPEVNYKWYQVLSPNPPPTETVTLETQFGVETGIAIGEAQFLALPALKNGHGDPFAPHLSCHAIASSLDPPEPVTLETQFGVYTNLEVYTAFYMCVPALKEVTYPYWEPPVPPLPTAPHYACYPTSWAEAPLDEVVLDTQFGPVPSVPVFDPMWMCAPAIKTIEGQEPPAEPEGDLDVPHLMCFIIPPDIYDLRVVNLETQFGMQWDVEVPVPDPFANILCVPATKRIDCPDPGSWPWPVPPGDIDCDGFKGVPEDYVGTLPLKQCPDDTVIGNEDPDPWPPDFDDDRDVDIFDVLKMKPHFGSPGSNPYSARHDLDGQDGDNDIFDVLKMKPFFAKSCA